MLSELSGRHNLTILFLALKNLLRRKGKSIYIMIALIIPVTIFSTVILTMRNADKSLSNMASKFGYTLLVQPKNINFDRIDQIGVILDEYIPESAIITIEKIIKGFIQDSREIITISPRLYTKTLIVTGNFSRELIIAGIDFRTENMARPSWNLMSGKWPESENEAVTGGTVTRLLRLSVGDHIYVKDKELKISGILREYNSLEDHIIFIPLSTAQNIFGKSGFVSNINIQSLSLDRNTELLPKVIEKLNKEIPNAKAITPQQLSTMKYIMLKKTFKFLIAIIIATVIISIFSIFNIVTTSLYSRMREIGLLKSCGASWLQLLRLFLYEHAMIGFCGGIFGYLISILITYLLDSYLLKLGVEIRMDLSVLLISWLMGILCSILASFYPTFRLSRIKITNTFRTQWEA